MNATENMKRKENGIIFVNKVTGQDVNMALFSSKTPNYVLYHFRGKVVIEAQGTIAIPNLWVARITVHDGEFEYGDTIYIKAATEEQAEKEARYQTQMYFDGESDPARPYDRPDRLDQWEEGHGYRLIELESTRQIKTLDELIELLYVNEYSEKHNEVTEFTDEES